LKTRGIKNDENFVVIGDGMLELRERRLAFETAVEVVLVRTALMAILRNRDNLIQALAMKVALIRRGAAVTVFIWRTCSTSAIVTSSLSVQGKSSIELKWQTTLITVI
jgi:hypothetical protein